MIISGTRTAATATLTVPLPMDARCWSFTQDDCNYFTFSRWEHQDAGRILDY